MTNLCLFIWMHTIHVNYNTNGLENSTLTEKSFKLLNTGRKWCLLVVIIETKWSDIIWKHANKMYVQCQEEFYKYCSQNRCWWWTRFWRDTTWVIWQYVTSVEQKRIDKFTMKRRFWNCTYRAHLDHNTWWKT